MESVNASWCGRGRCGAFEEEQEAGQRTMKTIYLTQDLDLGLMQQAMAPTVASG